MFRLQFQTSFQAVLALTNVRNIPERSAGKNGGLNLCEYIMRWADEVKFALYAGKWRVRTCAATSARVAKYRETLLPKMAAAYRDIVYDKTAPLK